MAAEHKSVFRRASIFSAATMLSRVFGLVRDVLFANLFGTSLTLSAFLVAFSIPNMMRRLLGEGALSGAFVPVFSDSIHTEGRKKADEFANTVITLAGIVLILLVVLCIGILWAVKAGVGASPEKFSKFYYVFQLGRVMFPYMFFICLCGLGMGILNTLKHFIVPALLPALMNVFLILAVIFICPRLGTLKTQQIYGLAYTVLVAGLIQLSLLYFPLRAKNFSYRPCLDLRNPYLHRFGALFLPSFIALAATPLNMVIDHTLALIIDPAAPSELYFANRLVQLPLGVFGVALSVALLPTLSKLHAAGQTDKFKSTFSYTFRQAMAISIPAMVGMIILSHELVGVIYQRGEVNPQSAQIIARVFMCYTFGLFSFFAVKITAPAFLAMHDSKTPMRFVLISTGLNVILNLILMFPLKSRGFAIATSVSFTFQLVLLLRELNKRGVFEVREHLHSMIRIVCAALIMGVIVLLTVAGMKKVVEFWGFTGKLLVVLSGIAAGMISYLILAVPFKIREIAEVMAAFRKE